MNMQGMTPWRMFWGIIGLVLVLKVIGFITIGLWILLCVGLLALLGNMIVRASPEPLQSRLGGMVATALAVWFLFQASPYIWEGLGDQMRATMVRLGIASETHVSQVLRPKGAQAEQERSAFCAAEEMRFTQMIQALIEKFNNERKTTKVKVEATEDYQQLQVLIEELKARATECQGGAAWNNLVKDVERLSAEANVDNPAGRLLLSILLIVGFIALIGGIKGSGKIGNVFAIAGVVCIALALFLINEARISGKGVAIPDITSYFEYNTFSVIFPLVWIGVGLLMAGKEKVNWYAATGWLLLGAGFWSCGSIKGFSVDRGLDHVVDRSHCTIGAAHGGQMSVLITRDDWWEVENDPYYLDKKMAMGCSAVVQFVPYAPQHESMSEWWIVSPKLYPPKRCVAMPTPVLGEEPQFYYQNDKQIEPYQLKPGIPFRLDSRYNGKPKPVSISINCS